MTTPPPPTHTHDSGTFKASHDDQTLITSFPFHPRCHLSTPLQDEKSKARAGRATSNVFAKLSKKTMQEMKEVGCVDGDLSDNVCQLCRPFVCSPGD